MYPDSSQGYRHDRRRPRTAALDETTAIGIYDARTPIIDALRMRATEGHELGCEALRCWLRASCSQPSQLIRLAGQFPKTEAPLRIALAAML